MANTIGLDDTNDANTPDPTDAHLLHTRRADIHASRGKNDMIFASTSLDTRANSQCCGLSPP